MIEYLKDTLHTLALREAGFSPPYYPQTNSIVVGGVWERYQQKWHLSRHGNGAGWSEFHDHYAFTIDGGQDFVVVKARKNYGTSCLLEAARLPANIPAALASDISLLTTFVAAGMVTIEVN